MPFTFYNERLPPGLSLGAGFLHLAEPGAVALTYEWTSARWVDALVGDADRRWSVLMSPPVGRNMASYKISMTLISLKEQGRPTFGSVLVAWEGAGGSLIRAGLLWSDSFGFSTDPGPPPWLSMHDLSEEGLVDARCLADVEEVMDS